MAENQAQIAVNNSITPNRVDINLAGTWEPLGVAMNLVANVKDYGAVGNQIADDTAAFQAAINANPGKIIFVPKGNYKISSTLTIGSNGTSLVGEGETSSTSLIWYGTTTNVIAIENCQYSGVKNLRLFGAAKSTAGFGITYSGCFRCFAESVNVTYTFNGIFINNSTETVISNVQFRYLRGNTGIQFYGSGIGSYRALLEDIGCDNPYPLPVGPVKTWTPSTSFTANDIIFKDGRIYQCSQSGTSGLTGPTGTPGTNAYDAFTTDITDGTAKWKFVCFNLVWILQDSRGYSLVLNKVVCLNGAIAFWMRDTEASGSSGPLWAFAHDLECDHNFTTNVLLNGGSGFYSVNSWYGSCLNGNGITLGSSFVGEFTLTNSRIAASFQSGIFINAGPKDIIIDGNLIGANSAAGSNLYNGIYISPGSTDITISNNKVGSIAGIAINNQSYGIFLGNGATDNIVVSNNNLSGNVSGAMVDQATGANKTITGNIGYNPSSVPINIVVEASPFTWTNNLGNDAEVFVETGTVSLVTLAGYQVSASGNCSVTVPQGYSLVVTYSVAPVMRYIRK